MGFKALCVRDYVSRVIAIVLDAWMERLVIVAEGDDAEVVIIGQSGGEMAKLGGKGAMEKEDGPTKVLHGKGGSRSDRVESLVCDDNYKNESEVGVAVGDALVRVTASGSKN